MSDEKSQDSMPQGTSNESEVLAKTVEQVKGALASPDSLLKSAVVVTPNILAKGLVEEVTKAKTPSPPSVPTPKFLFNETRCIEHINDVKSYLHQFAGQKAHNPFLFIVKHIDPLLARLENGEQSEELQTAILGLKKTAPVIPGLVKMHEVMKEQDEAKGRPIASLPPRQNQ